MYVGMSGGAAREPDVEPWRADWLHTRTHPGRAQCTPGPWERALVTPHKSIQSLKSRRGGRLETRSAQICSWQPFSDASQDKGMISRRRSELEFT